MWSIIVENKVSKMVRLEQAGKNCANLTNILEVNKIMAKYYRVICSQTRFGTFVLG